MGDLWTFEARALDDTPLAEIQPGGRRLTEALNGPGAFTFTYTPDTVPDEVVAGEIDVVASKGTRYVWRGQLLGVNASIETQSEEVTFAALGLLELLADRYIPPGTEYLALEATTLAWQIVEATQQAGPLGIVSGSLPSSTARSKTYDTRTSVRQAINDLAGLDGGFDYAIEPNPVTGVATFDTYHPRRGSNNGVVLELGRNIDRVRPNLDMSAGRFINHAIAIGADGVEVPADDVASQGRYRLREGVVTANEVDDATVLGDRARGLLAPQPRYLPTLELAQGAPDAEYEAVGLGDTVVVSVRRGWLRLDGEYRIVGKDTTWPGDGDVEKVAVTVEQA